MDFNKAQMTALEHRDGPMMVLAGPGSGKTTVITHRIKRLLEAGVDPSGILVITFTKAAAAEMKERFLRLAREEDEKRRKAGKKDDHLPKNGWSLHRPEKSQQSAGQAARAGSRKFFGSRGQPCEFRNLPFRLLPHLKVGVPLSRRKCD